MWDTVSQPKHWALACEIPNSNKNASQTFTMNIAPFLKSHELTSHVGQAPLCWQRSNKSPILSSTHNGSLTILGYLQLLSMLEGSSIYTNKLITTSTTLPILIKSTTPSKNPVMIGQSQGLLQLEVGCIRPVELKCQTDRAKPWGTQGPSLSRHLSRQLSRQLQEQPAPARWHNNTLHLTLHQLWWLQWVTECIPHNLATQIPLLSGCLWNLPFYHWLVQNHRLQHQQHTQDAQLVITCLRQHATESILSSAHTTLDGKHYWKGGQCNVGAQWLSLKHWW